MATKSQCRAELKKLGLELDEIVSYWSRDTGGSATIDAVGRKTIDTDCRGQLVYDYTATASEFWQLVIDEAREIAPTITDCPHPIGECDFHDAIDCN